MRSQWTRTQCLEILELKFGATQKDIKRSFHRLAVIWHPDVTKHDKSVAAEKFKVVSSAYSFLTDDDTLYPPEIRQAPGPARTSANTVYYDGTDIYAQHMRAAAAAAATAAAAWFREQDKRRQEDANLQDQKERAAKRQRETELKEGLITRVLTSILEEEWRSGLVRRVINVPKRFQGGGKVKININMTWFSFDLEAGRPSGFTYQIEGVKKWGYSWNDPPPDVRIVVYFD